MVGEKKPYRYRMKLRRKVRCRVCTHWDFRYLKSGVGSGVLLSCFMCLGKEPHDVYTLGGNKIVKEDDD